MINFPSFNLTEQAKEAAMWVREFCKANPEIDGESSYPSIIPIIIEARLDNLSDKDACLAMVDAFVEVGKPVYAEYIHDCLLISWAGMEGTEYVALLDGLFTKAWGWTEEQNQARHAIVEQINEAIYEACPALKPE